MQQIENLLERHEAVGAGILTQKPKCKRQNLWVSTRNVTHFFTPGMLPVPLSYPCILCLPWTDDILGQDLFPDYIVYFCLLIIVITYGLHSLMDSEWIKS